MSEGVGSNSLSSSSGMTLSIGGTTSSTSSVLPALILNNNHNNTMTTVATTSSPMITTTAADTVVNGSGSSTLTTIAESSVNSSTNNNNNNSNSNNFTTALTLSLFSLCSFLLYQRNKHLFSRMIAQRKKLFLLTNPGEDGEREGMMDAMGLSVHGPGSPHSDGGSVVSITTAGGAGGFTPQRSTSRVSLPPSIRSSTNVIDFEKDEGYEMFNTTPLSTSSHHHSGTGGNSSNSSGSGHHGHNNSNHHSMSGEHSSPSTSGLLPGPPPLNQFGIGRRGNARARSSSETFIQAKRPINAPGSNPKPPRNPHHHVTKTPNFHNGMGFSKSPSFYELETIPGYKGGNTSSAESGTAASSPSVNGARPRGISDITSPPIAATNHAWTALGLEQPLVIAMVGLPARGKSYLVKMIMRYLKWTGFDCKVFNVGSYRRQVGLASANSEFFDASNPNNSKIREELAMAVQDSMYTWLHETHEEKRRVAVFDATNTTIERRLHLQQRARKENVFLLFVESICNDEKVLRTNYELKLQNDDYKGMDPEVARKDFLSRVKAYEKVYETIEDHEDGGSIAYIKLINVGQKVITRNCHGYLPSQVAFYLQNVHISPRKIYLSVVAESVESVCYEGRVAGQESGELTERGEEYVQNLGDFIAYESKFDLVDLGKEIIVLTGTGNIHYQSVQALKEHDFKCFHTPLLNELRGGDLHGYTKDQIKEFYPQEHEKRLADKLNYRYPGVGGESYLDVMERVRPVIIELERQRRSIVIVCHIAVLRCIYAYFMGVPLTEMPYKEFETHRIYELSPGPFGCACSVIQRHAST